MAKIKKLRHKFNAKPTIIDDIRFGSKKESEYYKKLKKEEEEGKILFFLRQVPIHLCKDVTYRIDFLVFYAPKNADSPGEISFTEVKGFMTPDAKIKIAMAEEKLGIKIKIV